MSEYKYNFIQKSNFNWECHVITPDNLDFFVPIQSHGPPDANRLMAMFQDKEGRKHFILDGQIDVIQTEVVKEEKIEQPKTENEQITQNT